MMDSLISLLSPQSAGGIPFSQTPAGLVCGLLVSLALAAVMMLVYRLCHDSLTYNRKFNVTLMMLALASTLLLTLIQSNPLFSLGALGAMSICRIRTNTRDPRDLGFVFWSLAIGISSALSAYAAGLFGTLLLSAVMLLIGRKAPKKDTVTMVVRGDASCMARVQEVFRKTPGSALQSQNLFSDSFELVYQLRIPEEEQKLLMDLFRQMDGVTGANLLAPKTQVA